MRGRERTRAELDAEIVRLRQRVSALESGACSADECAALKGAEEALAESEQRYQRLVEAVVDFVAIIDTEGRLASVNGAVREMLGFEPEQVIGKPIVDFILPERRSAAESEIERVLRGEHLRSETILVGKDNTYVHVEYTSTPVTANGRVVGAQSVAWNVTERKRLERKLRESEERYRTLIESAGETIATVDKDGVFQFMNTTAARQLGGLPTQFVGKTMWELFPQEIADTQMDCVCRVLRTGRGENAVSLSRVRGKLRWYNTTVQPLRDGGGNVVTALVIARDIDDLKRAHDELGAYRDRMARAEQLASIGTLSATLTHELTQPLTVIRLSIQNSLDVMERVSCPQAVIEDLKDGLAGVSSAMAIIDRFRNFARRSSEKAFKRVALHDVARRVMGLLAESARRARMTLQTHGLEDLPLVCAHENDLEQLFFALTQNAVQAADGRKDSLFSIRGTAQSDHVELRFVDDCGGIAPEHLPHIFEPFFTTKSDGGGTGLGLCIAQRVVSQARGQLQVESRLGHGTTFVVTLRIEGG